jgi:pyridoxal phosphate enzyme (YggS family)
MWHDPRMADVQTRIDPERLRAALEEVRAELDGAAAWSGRTPDAVEVLVAGKYIAAEETPALVAAGVRLIGENRLHQLQEKQELIGDAAVFDFIGHLQRRKVREVLGRVRLIHSVDSLALAQEIARRAEGTTRVLVEVNADEEPSKSGIVPSQLRRFIADVSQLEHLVIGGLMAMPAPTTNPDDSRAAFSRVRELAQSLAVEWQGRHDLSDLSMGTSQDYVVAAQEGATIVRLGRGLIERGRV